jgi:hypothetical protein
MGDEDDYERQLSQLAAAQLIEQLKKTQTTDLELPIDDVDAVWLVTVKRIASK